MYFTLAIKLQTFNIGIFVLSVVYKRMPRLQSSFKACKMMKIDDPHVTQGLLLKTTTFTI